MMVQAEIYPGVVSPPPNQGRIRYQQRGYPLQQQQQQQQNPQYPSNSYYDNALPFPASLHYSDNYQQHMMDNEGHEEEDEEAWEGEEAWDSLDNHQPSWKNEYHEPGCSGNSGFQPSPGGKFSNYSTGPCYEEPIAVAIPIRPPRKVHSVGRPGFRSSPMYHAPEPKASPVYQRPPEYWGAQEAKPVYQKPEYWAAKDGRPSYPKPEYWLTKDGQPRFRKLESWATNDFKPRFKRSEY